MADTSVERRQAETNEPAPGPWDDPDERETWHPPQSAWWLYSLSVLTFGLWLCGWAGCVAEDLRRNREAPLSPCAHRVGLPVPFLGWRLLWNLARAIHALDDPAASDGRRFAARVAFPAGALVCVFVTAFLLNFMSLFWDGLWFPYPGYLAVCLLPILPVPFLLLQAKLNRFKAGLADPIWTARPYRFRPSELGLAAVIVAFVAVNEIGLTRLLQICSPTQSPAQNRALNPGQSIEASVPVRGVSGLYTLTPPDGDWVRVARDHFGEDTDLSLYNPGHDTKVIAWVLCDGVSVEKRVRFRRGERKKDYDEVRIEERRQLLDRPFVPISYTHYHGTWSGKPALSFAATVAHGDVTVEVIGWTRAVERAGGSLEALVRSLRLKEEATSCDGS